MIYHWRAWPGSSPVSPSVRSEQKCNIIQKISTTAVASNSLFWLKPRINTIPKKFVRQHKQHVLLLGKTEDIFWTQTNSLLISPQKEKGSFDIKCISRLCLKTSNKFFTVPLSFTVFMNTIHVTFSFMWYQIISPVSLLASAMISTKV